MYTGKEIELATHNTVIEKYSYAVPPEIYDQSIPQITTAKTIFNEFINEHSINGTETILDACCGTGLLSEYLGKFLSTGKVIGLDLASNMIEYSRKYHASKNVSFEEEDIILLNPSRKKSADIITCSWAVSHIAMDYQKVMLKNLYQYLKEDGKLLVLFPVMGSKLSTSIQTVVKSEEWNIFFQKRINNRISFSSDEYANLLVEAGFIQTNVKVQVEDISFKNINELECFVTTAVARYLPYLEDEYLRIDFIKAVSKDYLIKTNSLEDNIPYSVSLLIASAKRPNLTYLLDPITDKEYLEKDKWNGSIYNKPEYTRLQRFFGEKIIDNYILPAQKNQTLGLDVGCGDGYLTDYASKKLAIRFLGIDNSLSMIEKAKLHENEKVTFSLMDITSTEFNLYCQYPLVISLLCLHWVYEQNKALKNIYHTLQDYGLGYLFISAISTKPSTKSGYIQIIKNLIKEEPYVNYFSDFNITRANLTKENYPDIIKESGLQLKQLTEINENFIFHDKKELSQFFQGIVYGFLILKNNIDSNNVDTFIAKLCDDLVEHLINQGSYALKENGEVLTDQRFLLAIVEKLPCENESKVTISL